MIRGRVNPMDIGICQINLHYHGDRAEALGLDLFEKQDNVYYARLLFKEQGSDPWSASESCWARRVAGSTASEL